MANAPDPRLRPEYAQGELVVVTTTPNPAEAEMLREMLMAEGIPSMVRLARSFNPWNLPGGGPHEVLVRESGYERSHELIHGGPPEPRPPGSRSGPEPGSLLAVVLIALGLIALLVWLSGSV